VFQRLGLDYPKEWVKIAGLMYIPFDEEKQYHPEYEGYSLNITAKQADTILIGYPLMYDMTDKVNISQRVYFTTILLQQIKQIYLTYDIN